MHKNSTQVRELVQKFQANCERISEIADACEKEQRERTEAETTEFNALVRENQLLQMRMQTAAAEHLKENPNAKQDAERIIRENAAAGKKTELTFVRDIMVVSDVRTGGVIPLNVQDIIKPLSEGFILDKVGLPFATGLAGDYVWPVYEMVEATVLDEAAAIADSKINFSKLTATPARIGVAIPVSNQSVNQTQGLLEQIIKEIMPKAVRELLNKIVFGLAPVNTSAQTAGLVGPFANLASNPGALSSVPTFKELNLMKARVLETGIDGEHLCFIMTKTQKAILEAEPKDAGSGIMTCENDRIAGIPVYTTNCLRRTTVSYYKASVSSGTVTWAVQSSAPATPAKFKVSGDSATNALAGIAAASVSANDFAEVTVIEEFVGIGDWRYQPMGMFGSLRFIVDPYSKSRNDAVDFVLNCEYGTKTLRPEAFALSKVAAVAAA